MKIALIFSFYQEAALFITSFNLKKQVGSGEGRALYKGKFYENDIYLWVMYSSYKDFKNNHTQRIQDMRFDQESWGILINYGVCGIFSNQQKEKEWIGKVFSVDQFFLKR